MTTDPHLDPDDAELDFSLFRDTWRRDRRVIAAVTTAAVLLVGAWQTWRYVRAPVTFAATQQLRLVLNDANEFVDGLPFRLSDMTRTPVLDRAYKALNLAPYLPFEAFTAQVTAHGVRTASDEYEVRYQATRPAAVPVALAPKVLETVIAEWRRDMQTARRDLGERTLLVPVSSDATAGSLLARADTARRQLDRYVARLDEIASRGVTPQSGTLDPHVALAELIERVQDVRRGELEPLILAICRSSALTDGDRRYLETRVRDERLTAQDASTRASVAEKLAALRPATESAPVVVAPTPSTSGRRPPTVVVPGYVLPSGDVSMLRQTPPGGAFDDGLLKQMYDLGRNSAETEARRRAIVEVREQRAREATAVRERNYYDGLLSAASGPRAGGDATALDQRFARFEAVRESVAGPASELARRILNWDRGMEGVDYFVGPYAATVTRAVPAGEVLGWAALTLMLTPVLAFAVCLFRQFRRASAGARVA